MLVQQWEYILRKDNRERQEEEDHWSQNQKQLGLFSRSVDPNLAIPWNHLAVHCNVIVGCGKGVVWLWDFQGFPGHPAVQESLGTPSLGSENASFSVASLRCVVCYVQTTEKIKFTVKIMFDWVILAMLNCCVPKNDFSWSLMRMINVPKENVGILKTARDLETKEYF